MTNLKKPALLLFLAAALMANAAMLLLLSTPAATEVLAQGTNMTGNMTKTGTNTTAALGSGNISDLLQGAGAP
jgi:di/tricarboxylate transporter